MMKEWALFQDKYLAEILVFEEMMAQKNCKASNERLKTGYWRVDTTPLYQG